MSLTQDEMDKYSCDVSFVEISRYEHYKRIYGEKLNRKFREFFGELRICIVKIRCLILERFLTAFKVISGLELSLNNNGGSKKCEMCIHCKTKKEIIEAIHDLDLHLYGDEGDG